MTIGIAKFAVQNIGETHNVPVSTWVYPQTKEQGFYDFSTAKKILNFFIENVGEYPYQNLQMCNQKLVLAVWKMLEIFFTLKML